MSERGEFVPEPIIAMYQSEAGTLGYATGERAAQIAHELRSAQPGRVQPTLARIRFADEHKVRGVNAAMGAGVMVFDGLSKTLEVPWATLLVLNHMDIPYTRVLATEPVDPVEVSKEKEKDSGKVLAIQIPQDVQDGIRELYGEDELLRRIAEVDQRDAKLRDDIAADIEEIERARQGDC